MSDDLRERVARAIRKAKRDFDSNPMMDDWRPSDGKTAEQNREDCLCERITDATLAEMGGVRVKPLEWHKSTISGWNDDWHTVSTGYTIRCVDEWGWKWSSSLRVFGYVPSPEAAKAAAQADYETRILAAIEPVPSVRGLPDVLLMTMTLSDGRKDHYVRITCEGCVYDVRRYPDHQINRAEYEVAELRHVLLGEPEPDLMDERYADAAVEPTPVSVQKKHE